MSSRAKRGVCTLVLVALSACSSAKPPDNPSVQLGAAGFLLHLPPAMHQALDAHAPGFRTPPTTSFRSDVSQAAAEAGGGLQPLFAVITDLDADGATDAVVEGSTSTDSSLVVLAILNKKTPVVTEVTRFSTYDADAVGIYLVKPSAGPAGAFTIVNYPDESTTWMWSDGRFVKH